MHKVFDVLDTQGQNLIVPQDLLERYDPSRHPDAMQGTRSPDDIMKEFLDTFDVGSEQPGMITREEFVKYYTNLYASIDDEHYMELILRRVWKLGEVDLGRISSRPSSRHGTKRDAGVVNKLRSTVNEKRPNSASGK